MAKLKVVPEETSDKKWKEKYGWENLSTDERMELLEKLGKFDVDVNDDPVTYELEPDKVDYLRKKPWNSFKTKIANICARKYINNLIKKQELIIKEVNGLEYFDNINGAIITCNHFSPFDNFAIQKVFEKIKRKGQKLWKVIREGNYTNPPVLPFFFKNCDTLPLSSNAKTMGKFMSAIKEALTRGDLVLVYPEQSMWFNYRKPKPLKAGAFKFAIKANVPVVPIFITMEDVEVNNKNNVAFTVNILKPIYPDKTKDLKENINAMMEENYRVWVKIYEEFYKVKLKYNTDK